VERTIFALFEDALASLGAAGALEREGYGRDCITLLVPDPRGRYVRPPSSSDPSRSRVFQPLPLAEVGPAAITGPLAARFTGEVRERGGLVETLTATGFGDPAARHFFESLRRGHAILAVQPPEGDEHIVGLLRRVGARAVEETGAAPQTRVDPLELGEREVERGGVRIHSDIVEQPVEETVPVREEHIVVERRAVARDATDEDLSNFKEGVIEIHETIEEPVITKRRRVVEEIVVGKQSGERTQTILETVRKTQVHVEPLREEDEPAQQSA
jgi:uncharacterized protein (TIGR02271 family)